MGIPHDKDKMVMRPSYGNPYTRQTISTYHDGPLNGFGRIDWHLITTKGSKCRQTSNIRGHWVGNKIADYSDVVGASPVGAVPTTSSFST